MSAEARSAGSLREPLLSACIIASNRSRELDRCLASLHGLVDEIVFGDTGSQDRTPEIAIRHGARVIEIDWTHDFSAGRNRVIEEAGGRYVLIIDSDEWLDPLDPGPIRAFLRSGEDLAFRCGFYPRPAWTWMYSCRILRNDPRLRYEGSIHETILPSLQRIHQGKVAFCPLMIRHSDDAGRLETKSRYQVPLFLRALQEDPTDSYNHRCLAVNYHYLGRSQEALSCWERSLDLIRRKTQLHSKDALTFFDLIQRNLDASEPSSELLEEVVSLFPDNPFCHWYSGISAVKNEDWGGAAPLFQRLLKLGAGGDYDRNISYDERIFGCWSWEQLGVCLFHLRHYLEAADCFERACEPDPGKAELELKAQLCRLLGGQEKGQAMLK